MPGLFQFSCSQFLNLSKNKCSRSGVAPHRVKRSISKERGWILSRIYPFEDFLCLPKKRALRRFRQACGLGKVEKSSGQVRAGSGGGKWTGCANTRGTLWTYVNCRIEPQKLKGQNYTAIQVELREYFVGRAFEVDGTKKCGGRLADARNASSRKLADLVFRELYNEVK